MIFRTPGILTGIIAKSILTHQLVFLKVNYAHIFGV